MTTRTTSIIEQFRFRKVLVIGDFILDVYYKGASTRLSPEAPVPVVDIHEKVEVPGGAANTAINLKALGADVTLLSVVGADEEGRRGVSLLKEHGVHTWGILRATGRSTIVKSRVISGDHMLTRFDSGDEEEVGPGVEDKLINCLKNGFRSCDAVIVSDYCKGVITERVRDMLETLASKTGRLVTVDSRRLTYFSSIRPYLVKPNYEEAIALLGLPRVNTDRAVQIGECGHSLYELTGAVHAAVTLDREGALLFHKGELIRQGSTDPVSNPRVAGAGDTYVSAFTLALVSGADAIAASEIAGKAASVAVQKYGTASCSHHELSFCFSRSSKQISSLDELAGICRLYREQGLRIVFTNGCFDILHSGHVSYLNRARQLGDVLIVGVNRDDSIRRLKGNGRPVNPLGDRLQVLAGLTAINHVIDFGDAADDTPRQLIQVIRPHVFAKGGDYSRDKLPEAETVDAVGGEIVFLSLVPDHSTTQIIQRVHHSSILAVA